MERERVNNNMSSIPIIDISPLVRLNEGVGDGAVDRKLQCVVDQIAHACKSVGFFAVVNHGVDPAIINHAWDATKDFFDLDEAVKKSVPMRDDYPYGYECHESLGVEQSVAAVDDCAGKRPSPSVRPDSKETFSIGPSSDKSGMPSRRWHKDANDGFAPALTQYYGAMEKLARVLFRALALALQLNESWFLEGGRFNEAHQCALRILNYPKLEYDRGEEFEEVHIRAGAHTDYGAMTLLKSGGPGLQLRLASSSASGANGRDSSWIDVPHLDDAFIVNLGDLMQRWTNDRWRSTLHRVIAVADDDDRDVSDCNGRRRVFRSARRQSMAFFVNMNGDANIIPFDSCVDAEHPVRYADIKASVHLLQRHAQSMGNQDDMV